MLQGNCSTTHQPFSLALWGCTACQALGTSLCQRGKSAQEYLGRLRECKETGLCCEGVGELGLAPRMGVGLGRGSCRWLLH